MTLGQLRVDFNPASNTRSHYKSFMIICQKFAQVWPHDTSPTIKIWCWTTHGPIKVTQWRQYNHIVRFMYCYLGYVHFILQVHALFSSCVWSGWRGQGPCSCGVAVRVENSLFVHRTCEEISYRYSRSLLKHEVVNHICDNRHMVVDIKDPWTTVN